MPKRVSTTHDRDLAVTKPREGQKVRRTKVADSVTSSGTRTRQASKRSGNGLTGLPPVQSAASPPLLVDELDLAIIDCLKLDGRATIRSMAKTLSIGVPTVRARLRRLAETNVVRVVAVTDIEALGHQVLLLGKVKVAGRPVEQVAAALARIPQIISITSTLGQCDLIIWTFLRDLAHMKEMVAQLRSMAGVDFIRWNVAMDILVYRSDWGLFGANDFPIEVPVAPTDRVDDIDLELISFLMQDARATNLYLADQLGLSEGTIRARIKRMEDERIIHITAITDVRARGMEVTAWIGLSVDGPYTRKVAESLAAVDGVGLVATTLGDYEILLTFVATSRGALAEFVSQRISPMPGIRSTEIIEFHEAFKHAHVWARLV